MSLYPIIERELRVEARQAGTQWLRPLSAGVALTFAAFMILGSPAPLRPGPELFSGLHHVAFIVIWLLVPIMTTDCISRERREQTLGLLFLTPLTAGEVVLAKVLAQGLRAATVCVAVWPVLLLPLLMGGVPPSTVWTALMAQVGAFFWALAAGILASVLSRTVLGASGWAMLFVLLFLVAQASLNGLAVHVALGGVGRALPSGEWLVGIGLLALWNPENVLDGLLRLVPLSSRGPWLLACCLVAVASSLGLALVWMIGAWRLRHAWQEVPPSPRRDRVTRELVRLRFSTRWIRGRMRRQLERNPVGWLEQRRWISRAAVWGWVGLLALAQVFALTGMSQIEEIREMNALLAAALSGGMALVSAASLRRERETGVLELLLTTPLPPRQIAAGRVTGIWRQFLPALMLYAMVAVFIESQLSGQWWSRSPENLAAYLIVIGFLYLMVPVGGLWWSLRARTYVGGVLLTVATMGVLPWVVTWALDSLLEVSGSTEWPTRVALEAASLIIGLVGIRSLHSVAGPVSLLLAVGLLAIAVLAPWQPLLLTSMLLAAGGWTARLMIRNLEARGLSEAVRSS